MSNSCSKISLGLGQQGCDRLASKSFRLVDEVVVLHTSEWFFAIGQFYEQFPQVEDEEVIMCLEEVRRMLMPERKLPA